MRRVRTKLGKGGNSPVVVDLKGVKVVKEIPATQITVEKIEIVSYLDSPVDKIVIAYTKGYPGEIVLWEGEDYDKIGQWKDSDVTKRIQELYK